MLKTPRLPIAVLALLMTTTTMFHQSSSPQPAAAKTPAAHFVEVSKKTPAAKSKLAKSLNTDEKRRAFRQFVNYLLLRAYLDAIWHAVYDIPPYLQPVAGCIKDHESGNYAESTHPSAGSGAYQFVPLTWRHWFEQWAAAVDYKGGYHWFAYEAPWYVQDAVLVYTLTHGGAGNWHPRYGDDPCTLGMQ